MLSPSHVPRTRSPSPALSPRRSRQKILAALVAASLAFCVHQSLHIASTRTTTSIPSIVATGITSNEATAPSLEAAAPWLSDDNEKRTAAVARIRDAFAADPASATALSHQLLAQDPDDVAGRHFSLVAALAQSGAFDAALAIAQSGPPALRIDELHIVFGLIAAQDPATARDLAVLLQGNPQPGPAFSTVLKNWAEAAPHQVANYALTLPPGGPRALALTSALAPWLRRDPPATASWIDTLTTPAEHDSALCAWILATDSIHRSPEAALRKAATIRDESLRLHAGTHALREWAAHDPAAARRFVESSGDSFPAPPDVLLSALAPAVRPVEAD